MKRSLGGRDGRDPGSRRRTGPRRGWSREWGPLLLVALLALPLFTPRIYASDEIKYFAHLRSAYFDGDLDHGNEYRHFLELDPRAHAGLRGLAEGETATGRHLNDAPIGSAVLWAPFYVAADQAVVLARWLGADVPRDGYAWPYVWAICLASLLYGTAGLFLSYRLAREFCGRGSAQLSVMGIWFASPVVFYLYITPPMAHSNSLFATALFLLIWYLSRHDRRAFEWGLLGAAGALMILVRELNWLLLTPVAVEELYGLWETAYRPTWRQSRIPGRWNRILRRLRDRVTGYLLFAVVLAILVAPQFVVYRLLHGTWSPTPFVVEKFSWVPWHAFEVLFSGFHGLYSWTPILLFATLGLLALDRRHAMVVIALLGTFVLQVAVVGSYATWWGGASFGARRFINCTPLFVVGLGALVDRLRPAGYAVARWAVVLLVIWNFGLAIQYSTGMIPRDRPVSMRTIVHNQVVEVPPRLVDVGWRFLTERESFTRTRTSPRDPR